MENTSIISNIVQDLGIKSASVTSTVVLLDDGATIPFIARYRKERTGGLDEVQIRAISEKREYYGELEKRRETIRASIAEQGKLTPALEKEIAACREKQRLEDLYLPYKPKRTTKATIAREKGLGKLADIILAQELVQGDKRGIMQPFVDPAKGVATVEDARAGAIDIVAELVADDAGVRGALRECFLRQGILRSSVRKDWEGKKSKFEMYYAYAEQLIKIPSHRILAIRRGTKEEVLSWKIEVPEETVSGILAGKIVKTTKALFYPELAEAIKSGYERLIYPSLQVEVFCARLDDAGRDAIEVFSKNARNLLLAPPAGHRVIMGVDPGFRTGCKVVVVDRNGNFKEYHAIFPHEQNRKAEAERTVLELVRTHGVELIAIGNGTASKETGRFIADIIARNRLGITSVIVSEAGASVYSASPLAAAEFPDLDVTVRGAISIARRLQDPLAELVKIDPKSIGVGQYQHDVNQFDLKKSLDLTVESCVNFVGVNLNSASAELLSHVSGIGKALAKNIVAHRAEKGSFSAKTELRDVPKLGPKAFEQCAGFLRIPVASDPLDNSAIHPERYPVVEQMARDLGNPLDQIIGNEALVGRIDPARYVTDDLGLSTLADILQELKKPGVDPRREFSCAQFSSTINEIADLSAGMVLEGTVTNVTNFGAFVDIGVHQDGLVHISKMSKRYVKDPHDVAAVGDRVTVRVLTVDTDLKRVGLEMIGS